MIPIDGSDHYNYKKSSCDTIFKPAQSTYFPQNMLFD